MADENAVTAATPPAVSTASPATEDTKANFRPLIDKGNGVLTKRNGVWTYPGCENDRSGTNLVLPLEYVSDVEVQAALSAGDLRAAVVSPTGFVTSVRLSDDETPVVNVALAGSPEMGTELPEGSRVEHDAGSRPMSAEDAERAAIAGAEALRTVAPQPVKAKR